MRMTTGAWVSCLKTLLENYNHSLDFTFFGKPHAPIYTLAKKILHSEQVYCIGDNPKSDIQGARNVGLTSILGIGFCFVWGFFFFLHLVLTGVAQENSAEIPADHVVKDISEAYKLIQTL
jgi:ribonucleotide monophosphatase NagD (HAD superfamily)